MADTVDVKHLFNGKRWDVFHLTNRSDGTGESGVTKVDISTFTTVDGQVPTYSSVDRIEYNVWGFNYAALLWDHTTDDEIAVCAGQGVMDWTDLGGNVDPRSAGDTGDIKLTTSGTTANSGYDITLYVRMKS
jgi:hypothetical protein